MNSSPQIWQTEILPDGTHQVVLKPRRGVVVCLLMFAVVACLLADFAFFNLIRRSHASVSALFFAVFCSLFGGVALLGAIREARGENRLLLGENLLVTQTNLLNLYPRRKSYRNGHLKLEVCEGSDGNQVMLSLRHDQGYTILYVADNSFNLIASVQKTRDFGNYVSRITDWPFEVPRKFL